MSDTPWLLVLVLQPMHATRDPFYYLPACPRVPDS